MTNPAPGLSSYPSVLPPSLLLLILDIHPLSWSILSGPPPPAEDLNSTAQAHTNRAPMQSLPLGDFINVLLVFLNAHLSARWGNDVVVYGATAGKSTQLYPPNNAIAGPSKPRSNAYQPFNVLDHRLEEGLRAMVAEEEERLTRDGPEGLNDSPAIVSAMTKALCFINRVMPQDTSANTDDSNITPPDRIQPRIMVINATPPPTSSSAVNGGDENGHNSRGGGNERRSGYVGMMNCVFAAQKAKVPIDVLSLPPPAGGTAPPIFLQQASYLTEGIYWRWNGRGGLLQYLHTIYLSPPSLRQKPFARLPQDAVDFRAVCFCHHNVVDVGFVCSVCLSIYCKPLPVCQMCKTKFPYKSLPMLKTLAANIQPIPIPETIVPTGVTRKAPGPAVDGSGITAGSGVQPGKRKAR